MLSICDVEDFQTELQLLFLAPRHVKRFADAGVQAENTRQAEDIPLAAFARALPQIGYVLRPQTIEVTA